jgi:hypothetical protein
LLSGHQAEGEKLALALSASITRHATLPFFASRRVELRLAWKEPKTWGWVPGRSYIPDWKLEYVIAKGHREEKNIMIRLVKETLGYVPFVGRLAAWL